MLATYDNAGHSIPPASLLSNDHPLTSHHLHFVSNPVRPPLLRDVLHEETKSVIPSLIIHLRSPAHIA
jgi:hypothetical protein